MAHAQIWLPAYSRCSFSNAHPNFVHMEAFQTNVPEKDVIRVVRRQKILGFIVKLHARPLGPGHSARFCLSSAEIVVRALCALSI